MSDTNIPQAVEADSPAAVPGALHGLRLLLVDDSEDILTMLTTLCEMEGATVVNAGDGAQALEKLESGDFDVLVSDLGMPVMDGYTLLAKVRGGTHNTDIPAIALTGYGYRSEEHTSELQSLMRT